MRFLFFLIVMCVVIPSGGQTIPPGYKLVYDQTCDSEAAFSDFSFTQPSKWILADGKQGKALEFTGISEYEPSFRSPHTIGLITTMQLGSFILEADLLPTGKEYGHRDMCVIFGLQDPSHFYYSHIATKMDDNAHQIMLVNEAPRKKISSFTTEGVAWGQNEWHKVRVERNIETGSVKIYFDDKLIQETTDKTFGAGYIGFGSFDDAGKVDNIRIWSDTVVRRKASYFKTKT